MEDNNLKLYDKLRSVPEEALKTIERGRLKGMSDINPMWRIKRLTEIFGPFGIGWYYTIENKWLEKLPDEQIAAFVDIFLYYKWDGEWSKPLPGTGGNKLYIQEKNGIHINDDCYKMALTDAISVAAKPLGLGADVYWDNDPTKYTDPLICKDCGKIITKMKKGDYIISADQIYHKTGGRCPKCWNEQKRRITPEPKE